MKITIFQASKGDCLIIRGEDGKQILTDGGLKGSYKDHVRSPLGRITASGKEIDLVYVSHIDQDHIGGILQLMDDSIAWRVFDYQVSTGNTTYRQPKFPRPPKLNAIWHNAFKDQIGEISRTDLLLNTKKLHFNNCYKIYLESQKFYDIML